MSKIKLNPGEAYFFSPPLQISNKKFSQVALITKKATEGYICRCPSYPDDLLIPLTAIKKRDVTKMRGIKLMLTPR